MATLPRLFIPQGLLPRTWFQTARLRPLVRALLGLLGLCLLAPLVVACGLTPNPTGLGTHRQLGLPSCLLVDLYNTPCPGCGVTTAFSHVVRGQWLQAAQANAGGTLAAWYCVVLGGWSLASAIRGRLLIGQPSDRMLIVGSLLFMAVILLDWCRRLWLM